MKSDDAPTSKKPAAGRRDRRGRGRPSAEAGPAVSREELLRTAARMIGRNGFAATSIRALGAEAGVSHGTVQHHFPTKESLWKALVDEIIVPDLEAVRERRLAEPTDLEAILDERLQQVMTRPGLPGSVLADRSPGAEERLRYLADATDTIRSQAKDRMQMLIDAELVRPIDPVVSSALNLALVILASSDSFLRTFFDIDMTVEEDRDRLVTGIVDILKHGLLPRE